MTTNSIKFIKSLNRNGNKSNSKTAQTKVKFPQITRSYVLYIQCIMYCPIYVI